jgi:phage FluMu protein gp41
MNDDFGDVRFPLDDNQIEQMQLTRASLKQIRESISFWEGKVAEAEREEQGRGRNRIYHFAPHDV